MFGSRASTSRGEVRERSPSRLNPTSHVRPEDGSDGQERPGRRPRFLPESLATEHEYGSPASPGAASHRGPGTVPVQQPQQATPPAANAGGEGVSSSAPPGYAEFVTSAVRSAMEPFLQNMAQVVGEQTAQITQVSQRVDQLAAVVSQLSLNQASQVPVGGSPPRTPYGTPSPPRRQGESSSGLSSLFRFWWATSRSTCEELWSSWCYIGRSSVV